MKHSGKLVALAESIVADTQSTYQSLFEGLNEGIILCDREGHIVETNQRFSEILGYSKAELAGKLSQSFLVHQEDRSEFERRSTERLTGKSDRYEIRLIRKNKSICWALIQASPWLDSQGEIIGSIGAITDITKQIKSRDAMEQILRATANTTEEEFFQSLTGALANIFNVKYVFIAKLLPDNPGTCRTLSVRRYKKLIDNSDYQIANTPTQFILNHGFSIFYSDLGSSFPEDSYLKQENIVSYIGSPIVSSLGEPLGILAIMHDNDLSHWHTGNLLLKILAERAGVELERCLSRQENDRLQQQIVQIQKMEAIGALASGLAHDINNTMTILMGHLDLLHKTINSDSYGLDNKQSALHSVDISRDAAKHSQNVIAQLLNFAKPKPLEKTCCTIQEVVSTTIKLFSTANKHGIAIDIIPSREDYYVLADKSQLQQVITNIIINAADAMPNGGSITFSYFSSYVNKPSLMRLDAQPGIYVQLSISDTGFGIPSDYKDKIFEPFFTTKQSAKGSGLGLAMAYKIIQQHQGWIEVDSDIDTGTTFTIYLPLQSKPQNNIQKPKISGNSGIVLVLDDTPQVMELTVQFLEKHGTRTMGFVDPIAALNWVEKNGDLLSLVILDLKMPALDGVECFKRIRSSYPNLPVIILTGESDESVKTELINMGANEFFIKPLNYLKLTNWIDSNLKMKMKEQ